MRTLLVALAVIPASLWCQQVTPRMPAATTELRTGVWRGGTVHFEVVDGMAVIEGDMVIGSANDISLKPPPKSLSNSSVVNRDEASRWPFAQIPYVVDPDVANPVMVATAIATWNTRTSVQFIPRTSQAGFIRFRRNLGFGCTASTGYSGGEEHVNLDDNCFDIGVIHHEMGHSIGLGHEQQRHDRAEYLVVNESNIPGRDRWLYAQSPDKGMDLGPYDYASVMHYGPYYSSKGPGMVSLPDGVALGGPDLSSGDIDIIKRMYRIPVNAITIDTSPTGLQIEIDGVARTAPAEVNWAPGSAHTLNFPAPQMSGDGNTRYQFGLWSNGGAKSQTVVASLGETVYTMYTILQQKITSGPLTPWTNQGSVTVSPPSPDGFYTMGSQIQFTALPVAGNWFLRWTDDFLTSSNPATMYVRYPAWVSAEFSQLQPTTITSSPLGAWFRADGQYARTPRNFDWAPGVAHPVSIQSPPYANDTSISRLKFQSWSHGGPQDQSITPPARGTVYSATFLVQHPVALTTSWDIQGSVSVLPSSVDGFYDAGALLQATAFPAVNHNFLYWSEDLSGALNPLSFTVAGSVFSQPFFAPICPVTLSAGNLSVPARGGLASINVTASPTCYWSAGSPLRWAGVTSPYWTIGSAVVTMRILPNPSTSSRSGAITLGGQAFLINQAGADPACAYTLSANAAAAPASSSTSAIGVITPAGCGWNVENNAPWLQMGSSSGIGPEIRSYTVSANADPQPRTGSITIAGRTFTVTQAAAAAANQIPSVIAVSPGAGVGMTQTYTLQFSDPDGWQNLGVLNILVNRALDGRQACYLAFLPATPTSGTLLVINDAGGAAGPYSALAIPSLGSAGNSQCTISGTGSSVNGNGTILTLTLAIAFSPSFAGNKIVYMAARDAASNNSGWQPIATWNIPGSAPSGPSVKAVSPARSTGASATYNFTFSHSAGFANLTILNILINSSIDGRNACYLAYLPSSATTGTLLLVNDAGASGGPYQSLSIPGVGSIQNSQCSINGTGSSASATGNDRTLTLAITFSPGFSGNRVIYPAARAGGQSSDWQAAGSVTVP